MKTVISLCTVGFILWSSIALATCDHVEISIFNAGIESCRLIKQSMPSGELILHTKIPTMLEPNQTYRFFMNSHGPKNPADVSLTYECGHYKPAKSFLIISKAWHRPGQGMSQLEVYKKNYSAPFPVTVSVTSQVAGFYTDVCKTNDGKQQEHASIDWTVVP